MGGWAFETSLDVEMAHTMAPGANILLVETPEAETEGIVGFVPIERAIKYVVDNHLGNVISQSFGATEQTFTGGAAQIESLDYAYQDAANNGVTVLASSGDTGAGNYEPDGIDLYQFPLWAGRPVTRWSPRRRHPATPRLEKGIPFAPPNVWNDQALFGEPGRGKRRTVDRLSSPDYQDSVASRRRRQPWHAGHQRFGCCERWREPLHQRGQPPGGPRRAWLVYGGWHE